MKLKVVFFKRQKIWQTFCQTHQEKKEGAQINKIRNKKGEVTLDTEEIQRIITRDYYKHLYANKMDPRGNGFIERYNLPRLNQEEIEI